MAGGFLKGGGGELVWSHKTPTFSLHHKANAKMMQAEISRDFANLFFTFLNHPTPSRRDPLIYDSLYIECKTKRNGGTNLEII